MKTKTDGQIQQYRGNCSNMFMKYSGVDIMLDLGSNFPPRAKIPTPTIIVEKNKNILNTACTKIKNKIKKNGTPLSK